jgi:hypothetical protein
MKTFTGILEQLESLKAHLLQVAEYADPFGKLHCIVIFDEDPDDLMQNMKKLRLWCAKNRLDFPLVVDREFIESSQDSYPLELLSFSHQYRNILVKSDLLSRLKLEKTDVRLQMERELKSKWLLTRMALLEQAPTEAKIARIMKLSVSALLPVFKGFLYLSGTGIPHDLHGLLEQSQKVTGIDLSLLHSLTTLKRADLQTATAYLALISVLLKHLDGIEL